jgi:hypothetical protein
MTTPPQRFAEQLVVARYELSADQRMLVMLPTFADEAIPLGRSITTMRPGAVAETGAHLPCARSPAPYSASSEPSGLTSNATACETIVDELPRSMSARTTSAHAPFAFFDERYQI